MTRKVKKYIKLVAVLLVLALGVGAIVGGINVLTRTPNEDNLIYQLYDSDSSYVGKEGIDGSGIEWKIKNDGTIVADGEASANTYFEIGTINLPAGTYTFTANDDVDKNEFYVVGLVEGVEKWYSDISNSENGRTHSFTADTSVTFRIVVNEGAKLNNVKIRPCIVEGSVSAEYYV